jgi:hypothetical protein
MVSGGVSTNHVGGAAQFLLCRNTTSRYFLPVKLLENFTIMSPPNNSTSKIQKILQYSSEWDAEGVVPYNPEFTANSKHRRTMFAPTSHSGKFLPPQNRSALCVSTLRLGLERRCRFNSPISLSSDILFLSAFDTTICTLSACAE